MNHSKIFHTIINLSTVILSIFYDLQCYNTLKAIADCKPKFSKVEMNKIHIEEGCGGDVHGLYLIIILWSHHWQLAELVVSLHITFNNNGSCSLSSVRPNDPGEMTVFQRAQSLLSQ